MSRSSSSPSRWYRPLAQYGALLAVLLILIAFFGFQSSNFLTTDNFRTIANDVPALTFVSVGMTLVLVVGGIDLSVGSVLALAAVAMGVAMTEYEQSFSVGLLICLVVGALCGCVSGSVSILCKLPSFIVTLGVLLIARGLAMRLGGPSAIYIGSDVASFGDAIGGVGAGGWFISPAFVCAVLAVLVCQFILTQTVFGRYCVAIGTNAEAARMSGIRTQPYAIMVFAISGLMCGLAGLAQTSKLGSADPTAAEGLELDAIAACVIGGTSLMGGRGNVVSSFLGVLIIRILMAGLTQIGADEPTKKMVTGSVIVLAVLLDAARNRWGSRS